MDGEKDLQNASDSSNAPQQIAPTPPQSSDTTQQHKKLLGVAIGIALAVVVIVTVALVLLRSNKISNDAKTSEGVTAQITVCDDSIVNQVNTFYFPLGSEDKDRLQAIITEFSKNSDYVNDPTCNMIIFLKALDDNDANTMKTAIDNIEAAYNRQQYVNGNLQNLYSLNTQKNLLDAQSSDSTSEVDPSDGRGGIGSGGAYNEE
jgi:hypothetical protein